VKYQRWTLPLPYNGLQIQKIVTAKALKIV